MRDYSNSGLVSPNGITIKGHHNIVQMETRNEKKDRFEIVEQPQASQGEVATGQAPDLATRYSTLYEKPYIVPFSNMSPQMPERSVGVRLGEGTGVSENIRPLTTTIPPPRNEPFQTNREAYNNLQQLIDNIDVPTAPQDFTRSYEKTPQPDTTIPTQPIPEPAPFEPDTLYPAQTPEEYRKSNLKDDRYFKYNEKKKKWEIWNADGYSSTPDMRKRENLRLYETLEGRPFRGQQPQPTRARPIGEVVRERRQGRRPASTEDILMSPEQITQLPMESEKVLQSEIKRLYFDDL